MTTVRKGYLKLAMQSFRLSRTRSLMTMIGIVIGVIAVIVIVSIGEGVKQQIGVQSVGYGKDMLIVRPAQPGGVLSGTGITGSGNLLNSSDVSVAERTEGVATAVPLSVVTGNVTGDYSVNDPLVIATTTGLGQILKQKVTYGSFFIPSDGNNVVVLGTDLAHQLFSDTAPLGQKLTYRGQQFVVEGVFSSFLAAPFSLEANYNEAIFIPYASAQDLLGGAPQINQMFVKVKKGANITVVARSLQRELVTAHGGANDVAISLPGSKNVGSDRTLRLLTIMTFGMAVVALLVGGVGIMNMMLVSVTERIHEIGLRKAIGATNRQILRQFMTEAFVLCFVGVVIGIIGALIVIEFLRLYTSLQPAIVGWAMITAPVVSLAVGVLFGTMPALKAARMDPIEALRHE